MSTPEAIGVLIAFILLVVGVAMLFKMAMDGRKRFRLPKRKPKGRHR